MDAYVGRTAPFFSTWQGQSVSTVLMQSTFNLDNLCNFGNLLDPSFPNSSKRKSRPYTVGHFSFIFLTSDLPKSRSTVPDARYCRVVSLLDQQEQPKLCGPFVPTTVSVREVERE